MALITVKSHFRCFIISDAINGISCQVDFGHDTQACLHRSTSSSLKQLVGCA